jgi:hypothetical protein
MSKKIGTDGNGILNTTPPAPRVSAPAAAPHAVKAIQQVDAKPVMDAVRKRAYELYLERSAKGQPGDERTDWIRAEREFARK